MQGAFGFGQKKSKSVDETPAQFRAPLRDPLSAALQSLLGGGSGDLRGIPQFQGVPTVASGQNPFAAPLTGAEQQSLQALNPFVGTPQGSAQAQQLLSNTVQGDFLTPQSNPFLQASIEAAQRPVIEAFNEQILPNLRTSFTQAGHQIQPGSSSPFEMAAARAAGGLANALSDISTNIAAQNFQAERGRQQEAAQQLPQLETEDVNRTIAILQQQALPRFIEQLGIDRGVQEFDTRLNAFLEAIGLAGGLASPTLGHRASGFNFNVSGGVGGGGKDGAASAAALSDRRFKTDVVRIGTLPRTGLPTYEFSYVGENERRWGVMADEVEHVIPDAVLTIDGVRFVDYGKVLAAEAG